MPLRAVLPGYPIYPGGSKKLSVFDLKGLSTYTPGGETIPASLFGEGGIDVIEPLNKQVVTVGADSYIVALSFSGTYFVTVSYPTTTAGAVASVVIKWYVSATSAEAGAIDLSAETVRLMAIFV